MSKSKESKLVRNIYNVTNVQWSRLRRSRRYQRASCKDACDHITDRLKDEVLDGIFIDLNERSTSKSYQQQKRTLRRIVEKRTAQAAHKFTRHSQTKYAESTRRTYMKRCMGAIEAIRQAV